MARRHGTHLEGRAEGVFERDKAFGGRSARGSKVQFVLQDLIQPQLKAL